MTTPRQYKRHDAVHLITTTLARFQVELERDELRRRFSVNFGFTVSARHRDLHQATLELESARQRLLEKLGTLGTIREEGWHTHFEATNCRYYLSISKLEKDWRGEPEFTIGIYGCSSKRR